MHVYVNVVLGVLCVKMMCCGDMRNE